MLSVACRWQWLRGFSVLRGLCIHGERKKGGGKKPCGTGRCVLATEVVIMQMMRWEVSAPEEKAECGNQLIRLQFQNGV